MNKFDTLVNKLLMEIPYIDVEQHGTLTKFDLELEKYAKDLDGFKKMLKNVLQNGTVTDKYGDAIHFDTHEERVKFIESLGRDSMVKMFLKKYHNTTLVDVMNSIK